MGKNKRKVTEAKEKMKIKRQFFNCLSCVLVVVMVGFIFRIVLYPEIYITTLKAQLKQDIARNNKIAISYYQEKYLDKGIILF